jgi:hypothetical protein
MIAVKRQLWRLRPGQAQIDQVLTEFVARRVMKVTRQRPGVIEVKGGSALAAGKRAKALDWLPVRGRIAYGPDKGGYIRVEAEIGPRGRPHLRRALFEELYEHKLSSWLAELDRTLRARTDAVQPVEPPSTPGTRVAGSA